MAPAHDSQNRRPLEPGEVRVRVVDVTFDRRDANVAVGLVVLGEVLEMGHAVTGPSLGELVGVQGGEALMQAFHGGEVVTHVRDCFPVDPEQARRHAVISGPGRIKIETRPAQDSRDRPLLSGEVRLRVVDVALDPLLGGRDPHGPAGTELHGEVIEIGPGAHGPRMGQRVAAWVLQDDEETWSRAAQGRAIIVDVRNCFPLG